MNDQPEKKIVADAERRQADRTPLRFLIEFDHNLISGTANTRDIGIGGLYMTTTIDLPLHAPLKMRLQLGERELAINGTVVYQEPGEGVGIRFQDLNPETEEFLRRELPAIETAALQIGTKER